MLVARVFPRRTNATPNDPLAFVGEPPSPPPSVDAVHISVCFTWDLHEAERLAKLWEKAAPVSIGGPATGMRGEEFVPGKYLKKGYVITSRGCPNRCSYCSVWKREGPFLRELPITEGNNICDDNILACSDEHFGKVIEMLARQSNVQFTGGLEAARFKVRHAEAIRSVKPKQIFFAYESPEDWEPLVAAAQLCWAAGFTKASHCVRAYVLIGQPKDTVEDAERRLRAVLSLGIVPMAMLWTEDRFREWHYFQKKWARPASICTTRPASISRIIKPAAIEEEPSIWET